MERGDFSSLIFSSSWAYLQFWTHSSQQISAHHEDIQRSFGGHARWFKTPEVLFLPLHWPQFFPYFLYNLHILHFHSPPIFLSPPHALSLSFSLPLYPSSAPSISVLPSYLAGRTSLDRSALSALCIWTALCARVGLQPGVSRSAWLQSCCMNIAWFYVLHLPLPSFFSPDAETVSADKKISKDQLIQHY